MKVTLYDPVQAHKVFSEAYQKAKPYLMAGHRLVFSLEKEKRTNEQNDLMWALLTDVSVQVEWYGKKMTPEDWKHVFTAALKKQEMVPGIDGGIVALGQSTSRMTKAQLSDLIELIYAFGAEQGVVFKDSKE